jgi:flagellar hook-associated protein 1 FlgK
MALSVSLHTALTGLATAQAGMQTVSQNIANVNTEGYSRKTAQQSNLVVGGYGAGVSIAGIEREVRDDLIRELRAITSELGERRTTEEYLARIEQLFGSPADDSGLGATLGRFRSALEALATTPESFGLRQEAMRAAQELVTQLNQTATTVQDLRLDAERGIASAIGDVNTQLDRIGELNRQIVQRLATGEDATDLLDERDRAVMAVAEQMQVYTYTRGDGALVLATSGGRALVDGTVVNKISYTSQAVVTASTIFNPIMLGPYDISAEFGSGRIAALLDQRDTVLPARTAELNQLAIKLRDTVFSTSLATTDLAGTPAVNELNRFFVGVDPASADNAATIAIHPDLVANPALLNNLTAARELAAGASSETVVFAAAGDLPAMTTGFAAYGNAILAHQASLGAAAQSDRRYQEALQAAMQTRIGEVSGVNVDEELARMVELQKAYNAAARVIQAAAEMLDVLNDMVR